MLVSQNLKTSSENRPPVPENLRTSSQNRTLIPENLRTSQNRIPVPENLKDSSQNSASLTESRTPVTDNVRAAHQNYIPVTEYPRTCEKRASVTPGPASTCYRQSCQDRSLKDWSLGAQHLQASSETAADKDQPKTSNFFEERSPSIHTPHVNRTHSRTADSPVTLNHLVQDTPIDLRKRTDSGFMSKTSDCDSVDVGIPTEPPDILTLYRQHLTDDTGAETSRDSTDIVSTTVTPVPVPITSDMNRIVDSANIKTSDMRMASGMKNLTSIQKCSDSAAIDKLCSASTVSRGINPHHHKYDDLSDETTLQPSVATPVTEEAIIPTLVSPAMCRLPSGLHNLREEFSSDTLLAGNESMLQTSELEYAKDSIYDDDEAESANNEHILAQENAFGYDEGERTNSPSYNYFSSHHSLEQPLHTELMSDSSDQGLAPPTTSAAQRLRTSSQERTPAIEASKNPITWKRTSFGIFKVTL